MKKIYLASLLLTFMGACNIREQADIQKDVLVSEEVISISADSLLSRFAKDSIAANDLYMGEVLSVSGTVGVFEQLDTIDFHVNDSLPWAAKWIINRLESDVNTSNIIFKAAALSFSRKPTMVYTLNATFPKEYRNELVGIKKDSKITVKGKLENISTLSGKTEGDSTKKEVAYVLSLQGCILEKKE